MAAAPTTTPTPTPNYATHSRPDATPPTFLSLPYEIRRLIYHELLISPLQPTDAPVARRALVAAYTSSHARYSRLDASSSSPPPSPHAASPASNASAFLYPAILASCSAIHAEAAPILYRENTFSAHSTLLTGLPSFLDAARPLLAPRIAARHAIRRWHVHVRLDCDARFDGAKLRAAFDGADALSVAASEAMYRGSGLQNLLMFAEVRGVRETRVAGSVEPAVARWLEAVMRCAEGEGAPSLEEWLSAAPVCVGGGVLSERGGRASGCYNPWTHSNR